jgi:DNA-directed RNA polymerase subunit M/transcription elongation factor TFIIS
MNKQRLCPHCITMMQRTTHDNDTAQSVTLVYSCTTCGYSFATVLPQRAFKEFITQNRVGHYELT